MHTTCSHPECERKAYAKGMCTTHWSRWYRSTHQSKVTCQHCGATVTKPVGRDYTYCGTKCAAEAASVHASNARGTKQAKAKRRRAAALRNREVKGTYTFTHGPCTVCGTTFTTNGTDRTCSKQCSKELRRQYERRREYAQRYTGANTEQARYNRQRVFTADGYRCHICGRKTQPNKPPTHPRYPTIDHLIPLSQGGLDVIENCRTACMTCNSTRGNRGGGEQLMIVSI